jgi:hypothetical protein
VTSVGPQEIDTDLLVGSWRRLVLSAPHLEPGTVHWKAYTCCVLEQFHRMLRRREVFAKYSSKWGDPRAKLLAGEAWEQAKPTVLASLNLPEGASEHLTARAALLDGTYREVAGRLPDNAQIVFDDDGRLHFAALEPEPEPASLLDLRAAVNAMLPRVDLPEVLLEVFSWTGADQAFTSITGGEARLKELPVTIAALLVAHGCNVGYTPVISGIGCAQARAAVPRRPDVSTAGDLPGRERHTDRHPGGDPARQCVGRRAGRLRGRDAVRRPRAVGVRAAEPEVLRAPGRSHLAQHDQ